ncbi:nicotinate-nucleotide--dimethylbenzimidazole phosphoribosyltransferase, partial [Bradyrhizobium sp.]|uniref:nicotinate-nucleotide--dimethylbenzimidazole phosphoribosyltransferase n=1 Tax=Bradyrhizobium sp. TaxID=376 RepID=UPI0025C5C671
ARKRLARRLRQSTDQLGRSGTFACANVAMPSCRPFLLPSHQSAEQGHRLVLRALDVQPLISLDLRLGEGSGAAIALPLVRLACSLHNGMATFAQANVPDRPS